MAVHEALDSLHIQPANDGEDPIDAGDINNESDDGSDGNDGDDSDDDNGDNGDDRDDSGDDVDDGDDYANNREIEVQVADNNNSGDAEVHNDTTLGEIELPVIKVSFLLYVIYFNIYIYKMIILN